MNRSETSTEKFERQQKAVADLRLDEYADEEAQRAVIEEAAHKATKDHWPEMPEDERRQLIEEVLNFEAFAYLWAIYRRGWATNPGEGKIALDPETAGPNLLTRAYAAAESEALRMRRETGWQPPDSGPQLTLEDKIRRYLRPDE